MQITDYNYDNNYLFSDSENYFGVNILNSNIETITSLSIISTRITLGHLKIFRNEKLQRYHKHIKKFSESQKDNNEIINDLWNYISKDPKLHDKDKDLDS